MNVLLIASASLSRFRLSLRSMQYACQPAIFCQNVIANDKMSPITSLLLSILSI